MRKQKRTLNESQKAVVAHAKGPAAFWAVAGSGKTTTVIARMVKMISEDGENPEKILAVTFTKNAAMEMNKRLECEGIQIRKVRGDKGARVGTFHSLSLEIVRDGSPWSKYDIDAKDSLKYILKDILGWKGMNWKGADLTKVQGFISKCKNELIKPEKINHEIAGGWGYDAWELSKYIEAYKKFERARHQRGLMSFDDMLSSAVWYLQMDENAKRTWSAKYEHVIVDEYQDSNTAQFELVKILSEDAVSLLCVGDDDQLIYAWRGSKPEYSTKFEKHFPGAQMYFAEENYRSTPEVLVPANNLISMNLQRVVKTNKAQRESGCSVVVEPCGNMDDEAKQVLQTIRQEQSENEKSKWSDNVILYRTNAQSRAFEEVFIANKIPYVVVGGTNFYARKEVKDILSYLELAVEGTNKAFKRAVNRPFRFIGKATLEKLEKLSKRNHRTMYEEAKESMERIGLQRRQIASMASFLNLVDELKTEIESDDCRSVDVLLTSIIEDTKYIEWIQSDEGTDTAENSRVSNLKELVRTSARFESAKDMLDYLADLEAQMKKKNDDAQRDVILLMTIHKAKGLEWKNVFVAGMAQGILPHAKSTEIEEERRLAYVAMTRAKNRLVLSYPIAAMIAGKHKELQPSQFLAEAGLKGV